MNLQAIKTKIRNVASIKHFIFDHVLSNNSALNATPLIVSEYLYTEAELLKVLNISTECVDEFFSFDELGDARIQVNDTEYFSFLKLIQNHEFMDKISSMTNFAEN